MAKAQLKTKKTAASVSEFIASMPDAQRKRECTRILDLMKRATGAEPRMWGEHVVGFGDYHYKYDSGREGDWFIAGFSPRKENLTLYFMTGVEPYQKILAKLGKHKIGKGCLYLKNLEHVDMSALEELIETSTRDLLRRK